MAIIYSYPEIPDVQGGDLLLISDTGAPNKPTRSVDIDDLAAYIGTVVGVVQNLQSVLTVGNTYVSPDGYGTFTLNNIADNNGDIKYVNTDEGWGYFLNAEEGLFFTDGTGGQTGRTGIGLDTVFIGNSNHIGIIRSANITADRTYELPNASGTIALENLSNWYSVTGSRGLGNLLVKIGDYDNSGNGTNLSIDDDANSISINNSDLNVSSGSLILASSGFNGQLSATNITSARTLQFPDASGTIALTSDIPTPGPSGSGTTNYTARWTSASTLGIGALYDNGTNVGIGTTSLSSNSKLHINDSSTSDGQYTLHLESYAPTIVFEDVSGGTQDFSIQANTNALTFSVGDATTGTKLANERLRLTANGNVGIGTTSPSEKLEVNGNIRVADEGEIYIQGSTSTRKVVRLDNTNDKGLITLDRSNTTKVSISSDFNTHGHTYFDGLNVNVGIGTTSPSAKLEVAGGLNIASALPTVGALSNKLNFWGYTAGQGVCASIGSYRGNNYVSGGLIFETGELTTSERMRITPTGNVGIGTTSPNAKLNVNGNVKIESENELYFGGSGSVPNWEIKASGSDLVINDTGTNVGSVLFNNDEGVALPRLTTTEINAISSPIEGLMAYNTTLNTICFYNGSSWQKVSHANM